MTTVKKVRNRGRPVEKPMPQKIDRDPEHVGQVLMQTQVQEKNRWKYLEKRGDK